MVVDWSSSERLRLLLLHKEGVDWTASAERLNEEYPERPNSFFNEKNCKSEFDRICNDACPRPVAPEEPSQSFKKTNVIDAWITHLKEQVRLDSDKMVELGLVELRRDAELIERIMKGDRPPANEMRAMLTRRKEEDKKSNRDVAQMERVESAYRARFNQIFKEQRESDGNPDISIPPDALSISPTKASSVALQNAFRSPSPIKSPIRPIAEAIEEADAEMIDYEEVAKLELESPEASPLIAKSAPSSAKRDQDKASTVSPRTAADRAIGAGGLEEEREEEEEKEEPVKEEPMEVEESVVVEKIEKPVRKSTRASTTSVECTTVAPPVPPPVTRSRKEQSPISTSSKKEEKEDAKEEEGRSRRSSLRAKPPPPTTPSLPAASPAISPELTPAAAPKQKATAAPAAEEEQPTVMTRRSSRVEKPEEKKEEKKKEKKEDEKEEKKEEEVTKRATRRSMIDAKEKEKTEEKEVKEEPTFVAPSSAPRTRQHRGSEQADEKEKEKSEEPSVKTRAGSSRLSTSVSAKSSPAPVEKRSAGGAGGRVVKKEESEEKEVAAARCRKETSLALSERSLPAVGGKKEARMLTEISIRHVLIPQIPISPTKTRRGTERESPSTPRKSSRVSSASSVTSGRQPAAASVEVQTDPIEFRPDDEVFYSFDANEHPFHRVVNEWEGTKMEVDDEMPVARRLRGVGDAGEEEAAEKGGRSDSFSSSHTGTPSRRKESKRDLLMLNLSLDDDTGRYWLKAHGAAIADGSEWADTASSSSSGPSSAKKGRAMVAEIVCRRSIKEMDPLKHALFKAIKDMELHRHSSVFKAVVSPKEAFDYYDCVQSPICLSKLKTDVHDGLIKDPLSLKRHFALMFLNGTMFNSTTHDYWMYAMDMFKETYSTVRELMPETLDDEGPKLTRARRNNEPAFAKDAVLCERDRSMTLEQYFKCESTDDEEDVDKEEVISRAIFGRSAVDSTRKRRI